MSRPKAVQQTSGTIDDKMVGEKIKELKGLWDIIKKAKLLKESKNAVLSFETSVLIWQFCRKSENYLSYYNSYIGEGSSNLLGRYIWGFEELLDPSLMKPKDEFRITFIRAKLLDVKKRQSKVEIAELKMLTELQKLMGIQTQFFTLFTYENMKWEDVENLLRPQFNKAVRQSSKSVTFNALTLDKKIICHLIVGLSEEYGLTKKFWLDTYNELVNDGLTMTFNRMLAYSNDFLEIASQAPSIFFRKLK